MSGFFSLKGKKAAVTGGLGLIGRAVVKSFVEAGGETIVLDIDESGGKKFLSGLSGEAGKAFYEHFDITDLGKLAENIGELEGRYGEIDIWVNCAYPRTKDWGNKLEDVTVESWRQNVDLQLNSYCLSSNEIAKKMAGRGGGGDHQRRVPLRGQGARFSHI